MLTVHEQHCRTLTHNNLKAIVWLYNVLFVPPLLMLPNVLFVPPLLMLLTVLFVPPLLMLPTVLFVPPLLMLPTVLFVPPLLMLPTVLFVPQLVRVLGLTRESHCVKLPEDRGPKTAAKKTYREHLTCPCCWSVSPHLAAGRLLRSPDPSAPQWYFGKHG